MIFRMFLLCVLFCYVFCGPHSQKSKNEDQSGSEVVPDLVYSARDYDHFHDGKHNEEFDHASVLGSHSKAGEFEHLPPEEAKRRLRILATQMDANKDNYVDKNELTKWILQSFKMLTEEESLDELEDEDGDEDGKVTWEEHMAETFGVYEEIKLLKKEAFSEIEMLNNDKELFKAADLNNDKILDKSEYPAFSHPEEFEHMYQVVYEQALRKRDFNNDGYLSFEEFVADSYGVTPTPSSEHYITEKDRFENDLDADSDNRLNREEVLKWLIPDNMETAVNEADHLIESSDDDRDGKLSIEEIVDHHDVFVGSEATDFGEQLHNSHRYTDEL